jgi:Copper type II ascorbate-dependent monooxygenase, C-terminal domain
MNLGIVCLAALGTVALVSTAMGAETNGGAPTFSKDVAPILNKNCVSCHRPGEIAPMSLLTYDQARPWARSIREKVSRGLMPPWHADAPRGVFLNDRRLNDNDKATLIAWADAGAPQGNPKDLPPAPKFAEGWEIGTPDVVLTMTKPYTVPPNGTIAYQYFMIPTNFTEDKWVQAIEVKPGVRSVVHHILVFAKPPQSAEAMRPTEAFFPVIPHMVNAKAGGPPQEQPSFGVGQGSLIATTAPGTNAMIYGPGDAIKIQAGSTLLLQVHYTANGTGAADQSSVGLIFAKEPPQREIHNSAFVNLLMKVPAGDPDQAIDSAIEFKEDAHITALFPHTHLRGKGWEYRLIYPDGRSEVVLSVPRYDFNWQTYYIFAKPLAVPKGARLEATAHYDNSVNNPSNPDPKIDVRWGEQTWQEMQYTGITYYVDQPGAKPPVNATAQK